jgi:hypothetical protein
MNKTRDLAPANSRPEGGNDTRPLYINQLQDLLKNQWKKNSEGSFNLSNYAAELLDEHLMKLVSQIDVLLQPEKQNITPTISITPEPSYCRRFCQKAGICRHLS